MLRLFGVVPSSNKGTTPPLPYHPRTIADVVRGDVIYINCNYLKFYLKTELIVCCIVKNNSPQDRKIYLAVDYNEKLNQAYDVGIFNYKSHVFRNFDVLNNVPAHRPPHRQHSQQQ